MCRCTLLDAYSVTLSQNIWPKSMQFKLISLLWEYEWEFYWNWLLIFVHIHSLAKGQRVAFKEEPFDSNGILRVV